MSYYPIFVELNGKVALVVGGGAVAERKVLGLLAHGAWVRIVSETLTAELQKLSDEARIHYLGRNFQEGHLNGVFLVIAATDDLKENRVVSRQAQEHNLLVNAVDQPEDCNFIVPAVVRQGDLSIAVSTSGRSPAFAKRLRQQLEAQYGREYDLFLSLMGRLRNRILPMGLPPDENRRIFHDVVHSQILDDLARGDWEAAAAALEELLPSGVAVKELLDPVMHR